MIPGLFAVLPEILGQIPAGVTGDDNSRSEPAANAAMSEARNARTEVQALRFDVERLLMITEALWEILKQEHGYTNDSLLKLVNQIDMRDGRLDGKVENQPPSQCPRCHRTLMRHQSKCLYCGNPVQPSLFES